MTAQAGAAAFDDGEASVPAVLDVSADPFTSGDTSIEETETEEPEITPGAEVSDPSQELETPSEEPGATPSVTPIPDDTSEEPEDPDIEVFDPDAGIPDATPTPTPEPSVTPAEDPEEPDIFTSGDTLLALSQVVTEVDRDDWELADPANNRYKLRKDDGTYYTSTDGIVYIKTVTDKSAPATDTQAHSGQAGYYLFDAEGYMLTGQQTVAPGTPGCDITEEEEFFFMDAAHAIPLDEATGAEVTSFSPVTTNMGQAQLKYWLWTGTSFRYYDSTGRFLSVEELKVIREASGNYTGYYTINGENYCLDENGTPRTGDVEIKDGVKRAPTISRKLPEKTVSQERC